MDEKKKFKRVYSVIDFRQSSCGLTRPWPSGSGHYIYNVMTNFIICIFSLANREGAYSKAALI